MQCLVNQSQPAGDVIESLRVLLGEQEDFIRRDVNASQLKEICSRVPEAMELAKR